MLNNRTDRSISNFLGAVIVPHPPIIVPEIGQGNEITAQKTIDGLQQIARHIKELQPKVIVCITPHGNVFADGICILEAEQLKGNFGNFGRANVSMEKRVNQPLLHAIERELADADVPLVMMNETLARQYQASMELDHGCLVPLYYINQEYQEYEIVHISIGKLHAKELYQIGIRLRDAIEATDISTLIMASGDLSHTLKEDGPYGYEPEGPQFDEMLVRIFRDGKYEELFTIPENVAESAATCAMESIIMAVGAFEGTKLETKLISYEGPFGVGYMNAIMIPLHQEANSLLQSIERQLHGMRNQPIEIQDEYIRLARAAIEKYVWDQQELQWSEYRESTTVSRLEQEQAGVFVSIHKHGQLRGCIGTIQATTENLASEIIRNAIAAATEDPRFVPIRIQELEHLEVKVDILHPSERIESLSQLDVKKYGVIVESKGRRGLLLPNLAGIDEVAEQVAIAREKAGIGESEVIVMYRFEVERHEL
ncbi:hypothetical protein BHU72_06870 [Desulfuribacillus stibiiarsenatis]|uniref:AMMECR1 domain-containing protein n=1 Tax=Desulfuribacillus stibiiarsenatis TaxID=1390249 RepID=A0A1E5L4L5_9FIRM|nr:AmmeMemoRadiSam system protein A [Desulfuribacillus stibiiarsenatis]OEH84909.1 hypothetical protein BHU72_06870 [Desulfuribacillus stibiiarsenatis]